MTFPALKNKSVQEFAIVHYSAAAKVINFLWIIICLTNDSVDPR